MGKTETLRQRRVDVWVPTLEAKEEWKRVAAERGMSLSKMIIQTIEESIQGDLATTEEIEDLRERIKDLEAEVARRDTRIQDLQGLKERLEEELEEYRTKDILEPGGMKRLDSRLIAVLAESKDTVGRQRAVSEDEIRRRLRVENPDHVQAIAMQLEALELHGVIKATQNGWIWHAS